MKIFEIQLRHEGSCNSSSEGVQIPLALTHAMSPALCVNLAQEMAGRSLTSVSVSPQRNGRLDEESKTDNLLHIPDVCVDMNTPVPGKYSADVYNLSVNVCLNEMTDLF